jgi:hypothetical protein
LAAGENSAQDESGYIPQKLTPSSDLFGLEINADSGFSPLNLPQGFQMGLFSVTAPWAGAHWSVFANQGVPIGVTKQILDFDGVIPTNLTSQTLLPSACNP